MGVVDRALGGTTKGAGNTAGDLRAVLANDPNDTRALLRLAEIHAKAGDVAISCETYSRAGDVFVIQGFARRALSSFAQALAVARQGNLLDRVAPIAHAMGKLYVKEKLLRDAVTTLDGAARFLIERGADADARKLLEERIAIDDAEIARVRLAEVFFRLGQSDDAADQLAGVFARLHAQGRRDEALDVAERLLGERRDAGIARTTAELYLARNRAGDPFLALSKLRICCEGDPTHVPTLELLARAFDQAGHGEKAARVRREMKLITEPAAPAKPAAPPTLEAKPAKPKPKEDSIVVEVDAAWDDLLVEAEQRIDPSRASFWPADEGPAPDESGSVVSVSLADVELVDGPPPQSGERPASLFETALECIESLVAQGRYEDASLLIARHLVIRPRNPLLLERKAELEAMQQAHHEGPPPALFGLAPRRSDSQRSVQTVMRAVKAS